MGDKRSPPPILGQRHSLKKRDFFPDSVHLLGIPVLYRLLCMVCGREGPGVEFKARLINTFASQAHVIQVQKYCTKWETFRFALPAWNLFTQENENRA